MFQIQIHGWVPFNSLGLGRRKGIQTIWKQEGQRESKAGKDGRKKGFSNSSCIMDVRKNSLISVGEIRLS